MHKGGRGHASRDTDGVKTYPSSLRNEGRLAAEQALKGTSALMNQITSFLKSKSPESLNIRVRLTPLLFKKTRVYQQKL